MTHDQRWRRIETLARAALDRGAGERASFLDAACHDPALRRDVEALVATYEKARDGATVLARPTFRPSPAAELAPGCRLGPYRIVEQLGEGSMATVYLATIEDDDRTVAVKVARRDVGAGRLEELLRAEREILERLRHPNIACLHGGGILDDGRSYVVVEHVDGRPIDEHCERLRLRVPGRLELFRQVCGAIHYAHQHGVVHRDVKPTNVLVTRAGVPKLLDFGIALHDGDPGRADERPMTPQYASPEQIHGREITPSSDVYSLGVLLFRLLTAELPYGDAPRGPREMARRLAEGPPPPPSAAATLSADRRRLLRGELDAIVLRALDPRPDRRHASAERLSRAVESWLASSA